MFSARFVAHFFGESLPRKPGTSIMSSSLNTDLKSKVDNILTTQQDHGPGVSTSCRETDLPPLYLLYARRVNSLVLGCSLS